MRWPARPTLRMRLALVQGLCFLIAGGLLVGLSYFLVSKSIPGGPPTRVTAVSQVAVEQSPGVPSDGSVVLRLPSGEMLSEQQLQGQLHNAIQQAIVRQREETLASLVQQSLIALAIVAVLALAAGWLTAGRLLRPITVITETARRVADRSLHERIALDGPQDELKELADTFDGMLERLDLAFTGQGRFVANASHELRTPLAVNRTLLEVELGNPEASDDLKRVGRSLAALNERSERLIEGLLLLASSEQRVPDPKPVDIGAAVRRAAAHVAKEAEQAMVTVVADPAPAVVAGDVELIERLAHNLVENAVRHNVPGGRVEVTTGQGTGGDAVLRVTNTGAVLAPHEIVAMFEPFHRIASATPSSTAPVRGVGLGLSIVKAIVSAHAGTIEATAMPEGGLTVVVELPTPKRL